MGKRCREINCPYLATDDTCLLKPEELRLECPAREKVRDEDKDVWMDKFYTRTTTNGNPSRRRRERMIIR